ncbi:MAG TPA: hypothetical protein VGF73_07720 [Chthoniobacterales bacterium]
MKIRANSRAAIWLTTIACISLGAAVRADRPTESAEAFAARGSNLIEAADYEAAEIFLERALELEPHFWMAAFDRARISLLKQDWVKARQRFTALRGRGFGLPNEQLVQYEIFLTHLLAGEDVVAAQILAQLTRAPGSEALRYARAALARERDPAAAKCLTNFAPAAVSTPLTPFYAESLCDVGWERKPARSTVFSPNEAGVDTALISASDRP